MLSQTNYILTTFLHKYYMYKKVFIKTFGCQMNEYDSQKIFDILQTTSGLKKTDAPEDADLILLNTCSVREKAQEKVFSDLGRLNKLKKRNPHLLIGVGGCVATQEGDTIKKRAPYVDIIFGPQTLHRLPKMIKARCTSGELQADISFPETEKFDYFPAPKNNGVTAYVSIMEGCSKYCSYCIVPYTRGEEVSRKFDDILNEIIQLGAQGVKAITLLGQNVNAYRGLMKNGTIADFSLLINHIANIPDIKRIHFITSHPKEFTQRLIDTYATVPKLINHLYLPVQHGSNKILSAMKRGYTTLEYKSILRRLRTIRPEISISSDFIIGFPGETDKDFDELIKLVTDIGYDKSFSFIFSPRPGTPASYLDDTTPLKIKLKRLHCLQALIQENVNNISQKMLGTTQPILVEGQSKKKLNELQGRTENNRIVNFKTDIQKQNLIGKIVNVTITNRIHSSSTLQGTLKEI